MASNGRRSLGSAALVVLAIVAAVSIPEDLRQWAGILLRAWQFLDTRSWLGWTLTLFFGGAAIVWWWWWTRRIREEEELEREATREKEEAEKAEAAEYARRLVLAAGEQLIRTWQEIKETDIDSEARQLWNRFELEHLAFRDAVVDLPAVSREPMLNWWAQMWHIEQVRPTGEGRVQYDRDFELLKTRLGERFGKATTA